MSPVEGDMRYICRALQMVLEKRGLLECEEYKSFKAMFFESTYLELINFIEDNFNCSIVFKNKKRYFDSIGVETEEKKTKFKYPTL
jgi:hypothetical protein